MQTRRNRKKSRPVQQCVLPVTNVGCKFKLTFLRAPEELDDIIADLDVSARVVFFAEFFISKFFLSSTKSIF